MSKRGWTGTATIWGGLLWVVACGPVDPDHPDRRVIPSSSIALRWPGESGPIQRPLVEFDHKKHTETLKKEGCDPCHPRDAKGLLDSTKLAKLELPLAREARIDKIHGFCLGCHRTRAAQLNRPLPLDCGECHVIRAPGMTARAPMVQDRALHFRHVSAYKDACDRCHHATAVGIDKLLIIKGKETDCKDCHGPTDGEITLLSKAILHPPSFAHAAHKACLRCHEDQAKQQKKTGPLTCEGCHDAASQARFERPKEIARLKAGQPDQLWVGAKAAVFNLVLFPHETHEKQVDRCQHCHHRTQKPCFACHTATGKPEGGNVPLSAAFHAYDRPGSCVGCHQARASQGECRGCHRQPVPNAPGEQTCRICHSGPLPRPGETPAAAQPLPPVVLAALPPITPEDFPEKVTSKAIAAQYQPAEVPHGKMVRKLDELVRKSPLARRFHGSTQVLCTGCHHHTPPGSRPPRCSACHGPVADPLQDKPSLQAAYHRMCMDCHQALKIKAMGCTDCHKKAADPGEKP